MSKLGSPQNFAEAIAYLEQELVNLRERAARIANLIKVLTEEVEKRKLEDLQ